MDWAARHQKPMTILTLFGYLPLDYILGYWLVFLFVAEEHVTSTDVSSEKIVR